MRNSKQREVILEIINNSCNHLNAYGIYDEAKKIIPNISLGTVYRNLKALEENNLIMTIKVNGVIHYDKISRHQHFICDKCKSIIDVYGMDFLKMKDFDGNIVTDYKIVLRGICKKCQKEE